MRSLITAVLLASLTTPAIADSSAFWTHWGDGKAELNGYRLTVSRYGQSRSGTAVMVFVTEPFSRARKVKVDRYDANNSDHFTALKLNFVRKFQTGIYDYSVMSSIFADPTARFAPVKTSFSSQEWCGHVYEETHFDPKGTKVRTDSYFEGETRTTTLEPGLWPEENLFIWARGLMSNGPADMKPAKISILGSAFVRRLRHLPARPIETALDWSAPMTLTVPAGSFTARRLSWRRQTGESCTLDIEVARPHRVLGWACSDGEKGELTGTTRLPYWRTAQEGDEKLLRDLGLKVPKK